MQTFTCRSPQEIEDDALVSFHEELTKLSRALDSSGRLIYTGRRMSHILNTLKRVEDVILGGGCLPSHFRLAFWYDLN